jgi:hypothetical protein
LRKTAGQAGFAVAILNSRKAMAANLWLNQKFSIMDEIIKKSANDSKKSFFTFAARYSLTVSILTAAATTVFFLLNVNSYVTTFINAEWFWHGVIWLFVSSFLMGVVSLFGIQRHGAKGILWKAVIGIIVSSIFDFFAFALLHGA